MGKLNAPRDLPFAFRVVAFDGVAWLYDDSSRTYPCTATPHIYMEPLYAIGHEDVYLPDAGLFRACDIESRPSHEVPLDSEYTAIDAAPVSAWDAAREEAQANCLI